MSVASERAVAFAQAEAALLARSWRLWAAAAIVNSSAAPVRPRSFNVRSFRLRLRCLAPGSFFSQLASAWIVLRSTATSRPATSPAAAQRAMVVEPEAGEQRTLRHLSTHHRPRSLPPGSRESRPHDRGKPSLARPSALADDGGWSASALTRLFSLCRSCSP